LRRIHLTHTILLDNNIGLDINRKGTSSQDDQSDADESSRVDGDRDEDELKAPSPELAAKTKRLVDWNTDVLLTLLKQIIVRRQSTCKSDALSPVLHDNTHLESDMKLAIDEVAEIIELPNFDATVTNTSADLGALILDECVVDQLRDFVSIVSSMYQDNPFHNFEHASHVTMSVVKLMSRIVAPSEITGTEKNAARDLHDHTYGITSDPLTQFACVLSGLIHDIDHQGP
jgi:hypothetical protein